MKAMDPSWPQILSTAPEQPDRPVSAVAWRPWSVAKKRWLTSEKLLKGWAQAASEKLRPDHGVMFVVVCEPNIT